MQNIKNIPYEYGGFEVMNPQNKYYVEEIRFEITNESMKFFLHNFIRPGLVDACV